MKNVKILILYFFSLIAIFYGCGDASNKSPDQIADQIINNKITEQEFEELNIQYDEFVEIAKSIAITNGANEEDINIFFNQKRADFEINYYNRKSAESSIEENTNTDETKEKAGSCQQVVEGQSGSNGKTFAYEYRISKLCDGNSSDDDYEFRFSTNWADNADNIKWWATSWWVRNVFNTVYGGNLLGSSLCTTPVCLCLGTDGIFAAGGTENVKQHLYIWH